MKTTLPAMRTHLDGETTSLNTCIEITRTDGVQFFATDADVSITIDPDGGVNEQTFVPEIQFTRTAIENKEDLSVDNMDFSGVIDSSQISEQDVRNGLFDHAEVRMFLVNREDISQGVVFLRRGTLGELRATEVGTFFAEVRGLVQQLSTRIVEISTNECRADVGDKRCKVPVNPPVWRSNVVFNDERFPSPLSSFGEFEARVPDSALVTDFVTPTVRNDRVFRATVAGQSNPVEPIWNTTIGGATTQPHSGFTAWSATEIVAEGTVRRATSGLETILFVIEGAGAGTTGGVEPTWDESIGNTTADGTATWTTYALPPEWQTEDALNKVGEVDGLTPFTPNRRVFQVRGGDIVGVTGLYNFGVIEFTSGLNNGRRTQVKDWINASALYVEDSGSPNLDFDQVGGNDILRRDAGSFIDDGFVPGMRLIVSSSPAQNGTYLIDTVTALQLTIIGDWPAENLNTTGASVTGSLRQVTLFLPIFFDIADGDDFLMYPGCQHRLEADCETTFENVINRRAEDYLPGNDQRFRYPDARS